MQHGLIDVAGTWWFNTPQQSVGATLANKGWDMWFGNNRGTTNSYLHVNLTVEDSKYWDYSYNEMGKYDLPANVDYVLKQTGVSKITYMGHSQGTTQFWVANTMYPDLGQKIEKMVAFAPVMYLAHQNGPLILLTAETGVDKILLNTFDELLWLKDGYSHFDTFVYDCAPTILTFIPRTTWAFVEAIVGVDGVSHMSNKRMPMMARNDVGGSSTTNLKLWMKNIREKGFGDLDGKPYAVETLKERLANTDILLLAGTHDAFSQPKDVDSLQAVLPADKVKRVTFPDYNHLDYQWAADAGTLVDPVVYEFLGV
jgi:lysosomal acid lipase/cholesteryl ester hydrolase